MTPMVEIADRQYEDKHDDADDKSCDDFDLDDGDRDE